MRHPDVVYLIIIVMYPERPFIIGIGGAHSKVGKTTLASQLIRRLTSGRPCGPSGNTPRVGAVKYSREDIFTSITDDEEIIRESGSDTARLAGAGAEKIVWLRAPAEDMEEALPLAMDRLAEMDIVVIEGNSAVTASGADIAVFIQGRSGGDPKPSAVRLMRIADIIIVKGGDCPGISATNTGVRDCAVLIHDYDEATEVIIRFMDDAARKKKIIELLGRRSSEGRITCAAARSIAKETAAPCSEVGAAADELRIKICDCELGCF
jgi:LAO/AO transport system kinase